MLAVVWHVALFEKQYLEFGYFEGEPNFLLGFLTILIQGVILSSLFPRFNLQGSGMSRALKFSFVIGVFFWTSHVLAFLAKQSVQGATAFAAMESLYLVFQFGLFGLILGFIYRSE